MKPHAQSRPPEASTPRGTGAPVSGYVYRDPRRRPLTPRPHTTNQKDKNQ